MMRRGLVAMIRKEFRQIRRDKLSMRMLFALPILQTLILGYAMTRDVTHIRLGILDLDRSGRSTLVIGHLQANKRFENQGHYPSTAMLREALQKGEIQIGVVIPRGFATQIADAIPDPHGIQDADGAHISLWVDGQDASSAATAAGYAQAILQQWSLDLLGRELNAQGMEASTLNPLEIRDAVLYNPSLEYPWYMVPGMLVILVTMTGALLTSFSLVREKESGTFEQLMVTPIHPLQVLVGKAVPYWILSQITFFLALAVVSHWYGIPIVRADLAGLALGVCLYALTSVSLGIVVSTLVSSQQQALFLIWFCLIFFILTSGFLLPFESMPFWMQQLTEFNAVRHFLYMARALILRGAEPLTLLPEYIKLVAIAILLFSISVLLFRRKS